MLIGIQPFWLFSDTLSPTEILNRASELDGQTVVLRGEAIGECIERRDYCWINVSDGTIAIGVWMKKELVQRIGFWGGPEMRGDIVHVSGIVHRADALRGGELDVEALDLHVAEAGFRIAEGVPSWKRTLAIVLVCVTVVLMSSYYLGPLRSTKGSK
jgi:hypothetical protein